jgi:hypothetical protein
MLVIFIAMSIGVLITAPLILRYDAMMADVHAHEQEPLLPDEPAKSLPENIRWLIRVPVALFLGFIVTGIVNEKAAVIALKFGKDVVLDHAGKAIALWPHTDLGKALEIIALSIPFLLLATWIDRKWILRRSPVPPAQEEQETVAEIEAAQPSESNKQTQERKPARKPKKGNKPAKRPRTKRG